MIPATINESDDPSACKAKGNEAFTSKDFLAAVSHYSEAISSLSVLSTDCLSMKVAILSYRAASYLQLRMHREALSDCTSVLALDPGHVKALHRKGQAEDGLLEAIDQGPQLAMRGSIDRTL